MWAHRKISITRVAVSLLIQISMHSSSCHVNRLCRSSAKWITMVDSWVNSLMVMASSNSIIRHRASRARSTTVSSLIREVRAVSRIQHSNLSIIIWWFSHTLILEWWVLSHTQTTLASIKISNNSSLVICIQASRATCLAISPIRGPLTTHIIHNLMHHTTAAKVLPLSGSRIKISTT